MVRYYCRIMYDYHYRLAFFYRHPVSCNTFYMDAKYSLGRSACVYEYPAWNLCHRTRMVLDIFVPKRHQMNKIILIVGIIVTIVIAIVSYRVGLVHGFSIAAANSVGLSQVCHELGDAEWRPLEENSTRGICLLQSVDTPPCYRVGAMVTCGTERSWVYDLQVFMISGLWMTEYEVPVYLLAEDVS